MNAPLGDRRCRVKHPQGGLGRARERRQIPGIQQRTTRSSDERRCTLAVLNIFRARRISSAATGRKPSRDLPDTAFTREIARTEKSVCSGRLHPSFRSDTYELASRPGSGVATSRAGTALLPANHQVPTPPSGDRTSNHAGTWADQKTAQIAMGAASPP